MTRHIFERSFLVRRVQRWALDFTEDTDLSHVLTNHQAQLDEDMCNTGEFLGEADEVVDDDELTIVLAPIEEDAQVIKFPRAEGVT